MIWNESMRRIRTAIAVLALLPGGGCLSGPLFDNPMRLPEGPPGSSCENPVLIFPNHQGRVSYAEIFDQVLDVVDDHFAIQYSNRYEGRVVGKPTIAPGFEQPWKPGSPDSYERTLATLQAYRYRCEVRIREADPTGYFVQVTVLKELRDYPTTGNPYSNISVFQDGGTVDRDQFLIVDPNVTSPIESPGERWIPKGRETALEQVILRKLQRCQ
jgi:hypothetical protein